MRSSRMLAWVSSCLLVLSSPAWAQQGRGDREGRMPRAQQLSPEEAKAARTWQAREVARALELGSAETDQLVEVYVAGREAFEKARRDAREAGGEGERGGRWRVDPEVMQEHRAALQSQLSGFLSEEQTSEAMRSLGAFNAQWDRMVDAATDLQLGEQKTYAALVPIRQYVVQIAAAIQLDDRQAMRGLVMEAREGLYDDLARVLSEEQLAQFQEMTGRRGGGRQERARGPEQPGGREQPGGPQRAREAVTAAAIGEPAPAFTLTDTAGKAHTLADYGGKIVVLQWINPDCPVCRRVCSSGRVTAMRKQLDEAADNVVYLAVNTTHYMEPSVSAAYFKQHKIDAPVLIDRDGKVGHLYGAKRTPHMYVIDAEGILRYQGAIDDDPNGDKGDRATNYVVQAVRQIAAGETVSPDVTRAYGCTVKYAPK